VALLPVHVAIRRASTSPGHLDAHERTTARARVGRLLIAGQTAIAFALVLGGALFATSLARVWREDPGYRVDHVATMSLRYWDLNPTVTRARSLDLLAPLRDVPGVRGVALFDARMMRNSEVPSSFFQAPSSSIANTNVKPMRVSSGFFAAAGIQLVEGRLPSDAELDAGARVVVVTEAAARAYWPDRPAVGQTLRAGRGSRAIDTTVVGVVRDVRLVAMDVPSGGFVLAPWQLPVQSTYNPNFLYVSLDPTNTGALARLIDRIAALDPTVRVTDVQWLEAAMAESIRERRLAALAAGTFGVVALVFVALGLLGLVTMTSSRRTREVGIRMALGATPGGIARLLVVEQVGAVGAGLAAGALITAWLVPVVGSRLYGVGVYDLGIWVPAGAVMLATALVSAWLPAARASRIDPVASLREG
jgi:hypothetical protein